MTSYLARETKKFQNAPENHNRLAKLARTCRHVGLTIDEAESHIIRAYVEKCGSCHEKDVSDTLDNIYGEDNDTFREKCKKYGLYNNNKSQNEKVGSNAIKNKPTARYDFSNHKIDDWYATHLSNVSDDFSNYKAVLPKLDRESESAFKRMRPDAMQKILEAYFYKNDIIFAGGYYQSSDPMAYYNVSEFAKETEKRRKLTGYEEPEYISANPYINIPQDEHEEKRKRLKALQKLNSKGEIKNDEKTELNSLKKELANYSRTLQNTQIMHNAIIEFDKGFVPGRDALSQQRQFWNYIIEKRLLPVAAIVYTGGKGYHGIIKVDATKGEWEKHEKNIKELLGALGADTACVACNHLTRMPYGVRQIKEGDMLKIFPNNIQEVCFCEHLTVPIKPWEYEDILAKLVGVEKVETPDDNGLDPDATGWVSYDDFVAACDANKWGVRYNKTMRKFEYSGFPLNDEFVEQNAENFLYNFFKTNKRNLTRTDVENHLRQMAQDRAYNPVVEYLESLIWDGKDRLGLVYHTLGINDNGFAKTLVKKWLVQCVAMPHNTLCNGYGADGVLTLLGGQGIGKTSFFRALVPKREWFDEGMCLDTEDKDSRLRLTTGWMMELGEVDSTTKKEQSSLKALITAGEDTIRPPYGKKDITTPRLVSMCATVNEDDFLRDVENRRWWTVRVDNIDLDMMDILRNDIDQMWAQVYQLWSDDKQGFRLTRDEQKTLNEGNADYRRMLPYELEILSLADWDVPNQGRRWFTAVEYANHLELKNVNSNQFAKTLKHVANRLGAESKKPKGRQMYRLPPRKDNVCSGSVEIDD